LPNCTLCLSRVHFDFMPQLLLHNFQQEISAQRPMPADLFQTYTNLHTTAAIKPNIVLHMQWESYLDMSAQARRSPHASDDQHVMFVPSSRTSHHSHAAQSGHATSQRGSLRWHSARLLCLAIALDACYAIHLPAKFQSSSLKHPLQGPLRRSQLRSGTLIDSQGCNAIHGHETRLPTALRGGQPQSEADRKDQEKSKSKPATPIPKQKQKRKSFPVRQVSCHDRNSANIC
jgi:hypothetical protein